MPECGRGRTGRWRDDSRAMVTGALWGLGAGGDDCKGTEVWGRDGGGAGDKRSGGGVGWAVRAVCVKCCKNLHRPRITTRRKWGQKTMK